LLQLAFAGSVSIAGIDQDCVVLLAMQGPCQVNAGLLINGLAAWGVSLPLTLYGNPAFQSARHRWAGNRLHQRRFAGGSAFWGAAILRNLQT
jgi:hypothetical protein